MRVRETKQGGTIRDETSSAGEAVLLARLRAGDREAFEQVVREHGAKLLGVARVLLRNEDDARDALQDALLSAFRSIREYRGAALFSTWLHRIVINAALMKMRARRRRPEHSLDEMLTVVEAGGDEAEPVAAWRQQPDTLVESADTRALVRRSIDRLPDPYRTVLLLRDIEGLETESVARRLGVTPNAVKIRVHRARRALRALLEPYAAAA